MGGQGSSFHQVSVCQPCVCFGSRHFARINPNDEPHAGNATNKITKLDLHCGKAPQEFHFDTFLAELESRPMYVVVIARNHVCARS